MTELTAVGTSGVYVPDTGERFAFLLFGADRPRSIPLERTWSNDSAAAHIGYHVFVEKVLDARDAEAWATAARAALPPAPETTGFAWSSAPPPSFRLRCAVSTAVIGSQVLVVTDAVVAVTRPMPRLTIPKGFRITAPSDLATWALVDPRARSGPALGLHLLGALSGGIQFRALLSSAVRGEQTVKQLAAVRLDPLRPFMPDRTSITPLGPRYRVRVGPAGVYHLEAATR